MLEIQAIAIKLGNATRRRNHTGRISKLDNIQCVQEGLEDGRCETVVGLHVEGEEVELGGRLGAGQGAAGVSEEGGNGEGEEFSHFVERGLKVSVEF